MNENTENAGTVPENITQEPSQTPVEQELEREQGKLNRTPEEKAAFSLRKNAESVAALGLDPAEILGFKPVPTSEKDTPVTVGMLEDMRKEAASKTAFDLAESIEDTNERELTKSYLERIKPSGDAQEDLRFARLAVNSVKNGQIVEEVARREVPRSFGSGAGAPPPVERSQELTPQEMQFMQKPFNLTKEEIIAKRSK